MKLWLATDWIILDSQLPLSIFAKNAKQTSLRLGDREKVSNSFYWNSSVNFRLCHTKGPVQIVSLFLVLNKNNLDNFIRSTLFS